MTASDDTLRATERWFYQHGLPYFVEQERGEVDEALGRGRILTLGGLALAVGLAAGLGIGWWDRDVSSGMLAAIVCAGLVLVGYAVVELRIWPILEWTLRSTFGSLRLLFPLVTRALPLLLLFITFLFINAEVWQVAASMDGALLWVVVLMFSGLGVVFLVVRLPEEVDHVSSESQRQRLTERVEGTPVAGALSGLGDADVPGVPVRGLPRANLLLVLLVSQAIQVVLLALAVFAFFIVFGQLVMTPTVIASWTGQTPDNMPTTLLGTVELYQVSVFLAAFSGLYFTVYAVTDQLYRDQFFTQVSTELERAVGVRTVYLELLRQRARDRAADAQWRWVDPGEQDAGRAGE